MDRRGNMLMMAVMMYLERHRIRHFDHEESHERGGDPKSRRSEECPRVIEHLPRYTDELAEIHG